MKKVLFALLFIASAGAFLAFSYPFNSKLETQLPKENKAAEEEITWYTWEQAIELNQTEPRKLFIDLYTDWCGWCKRMDATTFKDPQVVAHINANYYPVKFDAEQKEDIQYDNRTFKFVEAGRRGIHELAYALLDGQLSYPSYVFLNEKQERLYVSKGFKQVDQLVKELNYFTEEKYLE